MYNRYIPQPDGSYQKKTIPRKQHPAPSPEAIQPVAPPEPPPPPPSSSTRPPAPRRQPSRPKTPVQGNVSDFLHQLLPKDFDTGDLLVLLLLLLMSGESEEERNTALLTAALYFFL